MAWGLRVPHLGRSWNRTTTATGHVAPSIHRVYQLRHSVFHVTRARCFTQRGTRACCTSQQAEWRIGGVEEWRSGTAWAVDGGQIGAKHVMCTSESPLLGWGCLLMLQFCNVWKSCHRASICEKSHSCCSKFLMQPAC